MPPLEISFSIEYLPQCKPLKVEGHPPLFTHLSLQNLHVCVNEQVYSILRLFNYLIEKRNLLSDIQLGPRSIESKQMNCHLLGLPCIINYVTFPHNAPFKPPFNFFGINFLGSKLSFFRLESLTSSTQVCRLCAEPQDSNIATQELLNQNNDSIRQSL